MVACSLPEKMQLRAPSQHREVPLWSDPLPPMRSREYEGNRSCQEHDPGYREKNFISRFTLN